MRQNWMRRPEEHPCDHRRDDMPRAEAQVTAVNWVEPARGLEPLTARLQGLQSHVRADPLASSTCVNASPHCSANCVVRA